MGNMNKCSFYTVALFAAVMFASCGKDDNTNPDNPVNPATLAGKWRMEGNMSDRSIEIENGSTITDLYSIMQDCQKDNFYQFNDVGTYSVDEGLTKCDANDPQILISGTWKLTDGTLTIDATPGIYTRKDDSHFTLVVTNRYYRSNNDYTEYVATLSFVKQ